MSLVEGFLSTFSTSKVEIVDFDVIHCKFEQNALNLILASEHQNKEWIITGEILIERQFKRFPLTHVEILAFLKSAVDNRFASHRRSKQKLLFGYVTEDDSYGLYFTMIKRNGNELNFMFPAAVSNEMVHQKEPEKSDYVEKVADEMPLHSLPVSQTVSNCWNSGGMENVDMTFLTPPPEALVTFTQPSQRTSFANNQNARTSQRSQPVFEPASHDSDLLFFSNEQCAVGENDGAVKYNASNANQHIMSHNTVVSEKRTSSNNVNSSNDTFNDRAFFTPPPEAVLTYTQQSTQQSTQHATPPHNAPELWFFSDDGAENSGIGENNYGGDGATAAVADSPKSPTPQPTILAATLTSPASQLSSGSSGILDVWVENQQWEDMTGFGKVTTIDHTTKTRFTRSRQTATSNEFGGEGVLHTVSADTSGHMESGLVPDEQPNELSDDLWEPRLKRRRNNREVAIRGRVIFTCSSSGEGGEVNEDN